MIDRLKDLIDLPNYHQAVEVLWVIGVVYITKLINYVWLGKNIGNQWKIEQLQWYNKWYQIKLKKLTFARPLFEWLFDNSPSMTWIFSNNQLWLRIIQDS